MNASGTTHNARSYPRLLERSDPLAQELLALEEQLLSPAVRGDAQQLAVLLHEMFEEVGVSGRHYTKDEIIALLATQTRTDNPPAALHAPSLLALSEHQVLLRWQSTGVRTAHRSSLWQLERGRWQLLYHQGTASAVDAQQHSTPAPRPAPAPAGLEATRARLRPLRPTDAPAVLAAFTSDAQMKRQGSVRTLDEAHAYIDRLLASPQEQRPYAIDVDGTLVGLVCASLDRANTLGWFWYWVAAGYRGRQLASRAAATVADHLLSSGGVHRLELGARANNPASLRVARAAGFIQEGVEREKFVMDGARVDVLTFGRLRSDPFPAIAALELEPAPGEA